MGIEHQNSESDGTTLTPEEWNQAHTITSNLLDLANGDTIRWGTDTNWYREGANTIATDDSMHIGGDLILDGNPSGFSITTVLSFAVVGTISTGNTVAPLLLAPCSLTINKAKIVAGVSPTGDSLTVDINKNGTSIFSTQGNRPSIADGGTRDDSGTPDTTNLVENDTISVDVDTVGSGTAGEDLTIELLCWQQVV